MFWTAVAMEWKIHVDAGKEDCYYQYVAPSATFYVSMQVFHGSNCCFYVYVEFFRKEFLHVFRWFAAVMECLDLRFDIQAVKWFTHTNGKQAQTITILSQVNIVEPEGFVKYLRNVYSSSWRLLLDLHRQPIF